MSAAGHRVLLGCMGLGAADGATPGAGDVARAEAAVEAALDAGITGFDHADIYGRGTAEAVFGEVLARSPGLRERITIQTKCGIRPAEAGRPGLYDHGREHVLRAVAGSLERLRTDRVDVLLLHRPDPLADPAATARVLEDLHAQGLVGAVGVSNMSGAQIAALQAHLALPIVVDQLEMSLHRRAGIEAAVLVNTLGAADVGFPHGTIEHCVAHGVRLQAWGPLAQGRYTGRAGTPADEAAARLVAALAERHGTSPETVLLWWLARHPAGIVPVIGTTRPARIRACADAARRPPALTHEEWYALWVAARGAPLP